MRTWFHKHPSVAVVICLVIELACAAMFGDLARHGDFGFDLVMALAGTIVWSYWAHVWWCRS